MLSLSIQRARSARSAASYAVFTRPLLLRVVRACLHELAFAHAAELTLRLVDEAEGRNLNLEFRGKDYATNVLTFDYARPPTSPVLMADIVLCAPVLEREAAAQGLALQAHLSHLTVHGVLHALGYDHETSEADAQEMEALEARVLARLGIGNPYDL